MFSQILLAAKSSNWVLPVILGVAMLAMFLMPMLSGKKKGKQVNDMRTTLRIGDEVMTIGGVVGKVIEIHETSSTDKDFVIETGIGNQKATMIFDIRALHENRTRIKELQEEAAQRAEQQKLEQEQKRLEKPYDSAKTDDVNQESANNDASDKE